MTSYCACACHVTGLALVVWPGVAIGAQLPIHQELMVFHSPASIQLVVLMYQVKSF